MLQVSWIRHWALFGKDDIGREGHLGDNLPHETFCSMIHKTGDQCPARHFFLSVLMKTYFLGIISTVCTLVQKKGVLSDWSFSVARQKSQKCDLCILLVHYCVNGVHIPLDFLLIYSNLCSRSKWGRRYCMYLFNFVMNSGFLWSLYEGVSVSDVVDISLQFASKIMTPRWIADA